MLLLLIWHKIKWKHSLFSQCYIFMSQNQLIMDGVSSLYVCLPVSKYLALHLPLGDTKIVFNVINRWIWLGLGGIMYCKHLHAQDEWSRAFCFRSVHLPTSVNLACNICCVRSTMRVCIFLRSSTPYRISVAYNLTLTVTLWPQRFLSQTQYLEI